MLEKGKILVIVSIPLLDNDDKFEIFNIINMSIPMKDPTAPRENYQV